MSRFRLFGDLERTVLLNDTRRWRWVDDQDEPDPVAWVEARILLMFVIFFVSLFASSFPSISRRIPGLRIPGVVFFIGKHFGTGVILATAFVHLLQDSYEALMNPVVRERWPGVTDWVGMIVLSSLLVIFLVEYISTSFVDRLHSYSSTPPSPCPTPSTTTSSTSPLLVPAQLPSPASSPSICPVDHEDHLGHTADAPLPLAPPEFAADVNDERTPLRHAHTHHAYASTHPHPHQDAAYGSTSTSHQRPPARSRPAGYAHTFPRSTRAPKQEGSTAGAGAGAGAGVGVTMPDDEIFAGGHHRHEARGSHAEHHGRRKGWKGWFGLGDGSDDDVDGTTEHTEVAEQGKARGRQKVKMNGHENENEHGPRHEHRHGPGHVHMDMESWGSSEGESEEAGDEADEVEIQVGRRRQVVGILMLEIGIMLHSLVIGLTLAITSGPEYTSLVVAIIFHQLFEGLSLGIRIATLPAVAAAKGKIGLLKPALAITFAITTPVGIAIGLGVFEPGRSEGAKITLLRGLMSALSAGMLIYAACVEMLAGDFVLDPHLWRSSIRRQALALASLLLGVITMGAVGLLGE